MMKKIYVGILLVLLLTSICLVACGKREIPVTETESYPTGPSVPATETEVPQTIPTSVPSAQTPQTLEDLLGQDYVQFLTDTITMQMENRMEKDPEVPYYPVTEHASLAIDETTQFEVDAEGYLSIIFPSGTVAAPEHGEQRFRVIRVASDMAAD